MRIAICLLAVLLCTSSVFARKQRYCPCVPATVMQPAAPTVARSAPRPVLPRGASIAQQALFHEHTGDWYLAVGSDPRNRALATAEYERALALEPTPRRYWQRSTTTANKEQRDRDRQWLLNQQPRDEYALRVLDTQAAEAGEAKPELMAAKLAEGIALAEELGHSHPQHKYLGSGVWVALRIQARIHLLVKTTAYDELIADGERLIKLKEEPNNRIRSLDFLARLLAACPDEKLRDPQRAVKLATEACELSNYEAPMPIETLAAAQAAAGDWSAAQENVALARQLVDRHFAGLQAMQQFLAVKPATPADFAKSPIGLRFRQLQEYAHHFESQVPLQLGDQPEQLRLLSLYQSVDWLDWYVAKEPDLWSRPALVF